MNSIDVFLSSKAPIVRENTMIMYVVEYKLIKEVGFV